MCGMWISDRGEVRFLLEVRALDAQRSQASTDSFLRTRSGRRAHRATRTATVHLDRLALDHYTRARTSFIEPRISFEAACDRRRFVRAVVARCLWFFPIRNPYSSGASSARFSACEPAATDCRGDHDGSLAQRTRRYDNSAGRSEPRRRAEETA